MKIRQVLETYNDRYAEEYDRTFLLDEQWASNSILFQLELLGAQLKGARTWLDVACGTGFVLSRFPEVERTGLDISPAMLKMARGRNPGVTIHEGNYLDEHPEFAGRFDVVSCMWWAYCMVETMTQIEQLVGNLALWTSEGGIVFLPLCNPQKFDTSRIKIPYVDETVPGRIMITGITWTWIQENGARHDDVVSPQVEHMVWMFEKHFAQVEVVEGPLDVIGQGWRVQDVLIARGRKPV